VCLFLCVRVLQVASLSMPPEFNQHFGTFFRMFSQQLVTVLPPNTNLQQAYDSGTDEQQAFVQNLALFFTGFFKVRVRVRVRQGALPAAPCRSATPVADRWHTPA
jgi:exportin-1